MISSTSQDDVRIALFSSQPALNSSGTNVYSQSRSSATGDYYFENTFNSGNNEYVGIKIMNTQKSSYDDTIATIQLEEGTKANHYTAYGTTPIKLNKISTYKDGFIRNSGKNLANIEDIKIGKTWSNSNNSQRATILHIPVEVGEIYTLVYSYTNSHITQVRGVLNKGPDDTYNSYTIDGTFTVPSGWSYISIEVLADTTFTSDMLNGLRIMFCKGSATINDYEPYGNGEWYLKKEIGEKVLNGTETWTIQSYNTEYSIEKSNFTNANMPSGSTNLLSDYFTIVTSYSSVSLGQARGGSSYINFNFDDGASGTSGFKTWLSTHNTLVNYPYATPTYTKITGTLEEQLEMAWRANTYSTTTNISQINNDLPFELFVTALSDGE